jgi:hypothetical protein
MREGSLGAAQAARLRTLEDGPAGPMELGSRVADTVMGIMGRRSMGDRSSMRLSELQTIRPSMGTAPAEAVSSPIFSGLGAEGPSSV